MSKLINLIRNDSLLVKLNKNSVRFYSSESPPGVKYFGFTYYPRFPEKEDPPHEPTKLFVLKKIRPVKGNPYWEKKILAHLKLDGDMGQISIVKNTPTTNARLYQVKHLIQITPITFPNGEPTAEDVKSLGATFLDEFGKMKVVPKLPGSSSEVLEPPKVTSRVEGDTLRRHLRLKWLRGME